MGMQKPGVQPWPVIMNGQLTEIGHYDRSLSLGGRRQRRAALVTVAVAPIASAATPDLRRVTTLHLPFLRSLQPPLTQIPGAPRRIHSLPGRDHMKVLRTEAADLSASVIPGNCK
ncbi:hypothetical protein Dimus_007339 [Dionaea muscipula]